MHEMSLALSIVDAVEAKARAEGAGSVSEIALLVGSFAGVDADALRFCFPAASKGTLAETARLVIEEREAEGVCRACGCRFPVTRYVSVCPDCRSLAVDIDSGREFLIQSMTIEEE